MPPIDHIVYAAPVRAEDLDAVCHYHELWPEPAKLPLLPALPLTLAELELLLQGPVVDLGAIAEVAKRDAGMTAQLLLLANHNREESDRLYRLEDCLVQIGISPLRELVRVMPPVLPSDRQGRMLLTHSRRTALAAETIAHHVPGVVPEKAYLAGLLHLLPELVSLEAGADWPLPEFASEVIRGFQHPFAVSGEERRLYEVVLAACEWAGEPELRPTPKCPPRLIGS